MLQTMATTATPTELSAGQPDANGTFGALSVPSYPFFWASSWAWNIARWMGLFSASYLVFHRGGSTLAVQLVGAAYFAPMFVGGLAGGVIADRFDRRRLVIYQLWLLVLVSALVSLDIVAGTARPWHIYAAMALLGCGSVSDTTCRRALVIDMAGQRLLTNAFALESISMTGGTLLGNLFGGALIEGAGTAAAFGGMGLLCGVGALLMVRVRVPAHRQITPSRDPVVKQLAVAVRYTAHNRALIGILAVTVVMNVFFYTYLPLVPAFAKQLDVNAFWAGVLGSAAGFGSLAGSFAIAALPNRVACVRLYAGGVAIALLGLIWFALSAHYGVALAGLFVAGIGTAGFTTMQSTLVLATSPVELRGRAMGILSMAIGSLPFALFALGAIAETTGMAVAVRWSGILGLVALAACWTAGRSLRDGK